MEPWNNRILKAPPTSTYFSHTKLVDLGHLQKLLHDGIIFFNDQHLFNLEIALLTRIIYRMKTKFRNSKDFKCLERVKKYLVMYSQINVPMEMSHLLSTLPSCFSRYELCLPTKNMVDFLLVRLQSIGKLLCSCVEMCKLTAKYYDCRLYLGHYWRLALIAIGMVSRIHMLSLNIIKFTCLFYVRLLPFANKLKNSGANWLPNDYVFPKDLQEWLGIEWTTFEEVIEVSDPEMNIPLFDLVDDSDDDVEFCSEYIEVDEDEDIELMREFNKINENKVEPIDLESSVTILRGFASRNDDIGEVLISEDEDVELHSENKTVEEPRISSLEEGNRCEDENQLDIGEIISSDEETFVLGQIVVENKNDDHIIGEEVISSDEGSQPCVLTIDDTLTENNDEANLNNKHQREENMESHQTEVIISSSDEDIESIEDSIEFVETQAIVPSKQKFVTSDFISFDDQTIEEKLSSKNVQTMNVGVSSRLNRKKKKRVRRPVESTDKKILKIIEPPHGKTIPIIDRKRKFKPEINVVEIPGIPPKNTEITLEPPSSNSFPSVYRKRKRTSNVEMSIVEIPETPSENMEISFEPQTSNSCSIIDRRRKRKSNLQKSVVEMPDTLPGNEDITLEPVDVSNRSIQKKRKEKKKKFKKQSLDTPAMKESSLLLGKKNPSSPNRVEKKNVLKYDKTYKDQRSDALPSGSSDEIKAKTVSVVTSTALRKRKNTRKNNLLSSEIPIKEFSQISNPKILPIKRKNSKSLKQAVEETIQPEVLRHKTRRKSIAGSPKQGIKKMNMNVSLRNNSKKKQKNRKQKK